MNQSEIIKREIGKLIDEGMTDKHLIFSKVVETLGVPRPTVRRCARDLKTDLLKQLKILNEGIEVEQKI